MPILKSTRPVTTGPPSTGTIQPPLNYLSETEIITKHYIKRYEVMSTFLLLPFSTGVILSNVIVTEGKNVFRQKCQKTWQADAIFKFEMYKTRLLPIVPEELIAYIQRSPKHPGWISGGQKMGAGRVEHRSTIRISRILRILRNSRIFTNFNRQNEFYFFLQFWVSTHQSTAFLQGANWNFVIIQELIYVGYQQSK